MKRREFITLAAALWPLAARAQQHDRARHLGVLWGLAENDNVYEPYLLAFKQRLQDLGWIDGRNVRVDYRFTGGLTERIRVQARELVTLAPDAIFATTNPAVAGSIAGDADHSDCLHASFRLGGKRLRSELGASGWKYYGVPQF
jgi:putative ABC transport system substrate-binding protein